ARDHQRQSGILCAGDRNCSVEPLPALNANAIHATPLDTQPGPDTRQPRERGLGRTARLALILPDDSGGIVGRGACRLRRRGTAFRLRLAALEVFSQRRAQTPLPPQLLCALVTTAHGNNSRSRREGSEERLAMIRR